MRMARDIMFVGLWFIGYQWTYVPLCREIFQTEPWSAGKVGLITLIVGVTLGLIAKAAKREIDA